MDTAGHEGETGSSSPLFSAVGGIDAPRGASEGTPSPGAVGGVQDEAKVSCDILLIDHMVSSARPPAAVRSITANIHSTRSELFPIWCAGGAEEKMFWASVQRDGVRPGMKESF